MARVKILRQRYPDAFDDWFGNDSILSNLSNDQLKVCLSKSKKEWEEKQLLINKQRAHEQALIEEQRQRVLLEEQREKDLIEKKKRLSTARRLYRKFPNAIKKLYNIYYPSSDYEADLILSADVIELQREEDELRHKQDEIWHKQAEISRQYNEIKSNYPQGLALVKKLRSERKPIEEIYTPTEIKAFKRGSAIYNTPRRLVLLPEHLFNKYNSIGIEVSFMEKWLQKQSDFFSNISVSCGSFFQQRKSKVVLRGRGETGQDRLYAFQICHIYDTAYCLSNYYCTYYPLWKKEATLNQDFLNQKRYYTTYFYDKVLAFIEEFDRKPLVLIADSGLGDEWGSLEDYHFSYLKDQLKKRRIKILPYKNIDDIIRYNETSILIIELLSNYARFRKICVEVLQRTRHRQARIVYFSLRREVSQDEANSIIQNDETIKKAAERNRNIKYLFFDTETTGLPGDYKAPSSDTSNWPRLVQLSWILTDSVGKVLSNKDFIIKPSGFTIPKESTGKHRITTEIAMRKGVKLSSVLDIFMDDYERCDVLVGHNIEFDKKIIGAELIRLGKKDVMEEKRSICTMKSSIDYCKIPSKNGTGYKYPTLQELYIKLFSHSFEDAHNAAADIAATKNCFWEMRRRGLI